MNVLSQRAVLVSLCCFSVVGCDAPSDSGTPLSADPVVVYSGIADKTLLPQLFDAYTEETGVTVIVRHGEAAAIVDDVIANEISPPADLLVSSSVNGVWRAAEEGALRPVRLQALSSRIPAWLRDPDQFWFALNYRPAVIVVHNDFAQVVVDDFAQLADAAYRGRLCLSSSALAHNRAVIALLIDTLGVRDAEITVRSWMANLAEPVFSDDETLRAAVQAGDCGIAISADGPGVDGRLPERHAGDADAAAVARHARNPDGASKLLEWLVADAAQAQLAEARASRRAVDSITAAPRNIAVNAWRRSEASKLAERVQYR